MSSPPAKFSTSASTNHTSNPQDQQKVIGDAAPKESACARRRQATIELTPRPCKLLTDARSEHLPQRQGSFVLVPRPCKLLVESEYPHGKHILDCRAPASILANCPNRNMREFTHMRYTAVTCDPDRFKECEFTLRQMHFDPPRETELLIGITMSNEDEELFSQTMYGVMKNIASLTRRHGSRIWGPESWRKVVVCIVVDGVNQIHPKTLEVLVAMGAYQEGFFKSQVGLKEVMANIYEYTTLVAPAAPSLKIKNRDPLFVPVQIVLCLKNQSLGKLNSHRWIFNAFAAILNPFACILLDVGAIPGPTSICQLWKAIQLDKYLAVARGEVVALNTMYGRSLVKCGDWFEWTMRYLFPRLFQKAVYSRRRTKQAFIAFRYVPLQYWPKGSTGRLQRYLENAAKHDGAGANSSVAVELVLMREVVPKGVAYWTSRCVKSAYAISST